MKEFPIVALILIGAVGALGYWRRWLSVAKEGKVRVHVDPEKFEQDKAAFSKTAGEKAMEMRDRVASPWDKSKGLTGDGKAHVEKELAELEKMRDQIEKQLKKHEDADRDKFEATNQGLSKILEEVEKKIEELTTKLEKEKEK